MIKDDSGRERRERNPMRKISRHMTAAFGVAGCLSQGLVLANPSNPVVIHGSASFSTQGPQLTIHTSANTLINWASFNIGANETTTFIQPSANSVVWNHISDPNPTQILGHLDANGYVVLQNQSGFYIGGNAVVNAQGLVMTTTSYVPPDIFGSGSWDFTAPAPTAKIINYGELNAGPGGSMFLISQDIENNGAITAPGGNVGLYAGEKVEISTRADGRGMTAKVTLPEGSVDNTGKIVADAGTIALNAQVVNQGGLVEANSVQSHDGVIDIVASDNVSLGPNSTISAHGDSQGVSAGGKVTIKSGGSYSDTATSVVDVSGGAQGGNGGKVEISAKQMNAIQAQVDGLADKGWVGGNMTIDPQNIVLAATGSTATSGTVTEGSAPATGTLTLNPNSLDSFSTILLQASQNITLSTPWTVGDSPTAATLTLQAGNKILFNNNDSLTVGQNWTVNLIAGANFVTPTSVTSTTTSGQGEILMSGNATIQSVNGNINLIAGGEILTGSTPITSTGLAATGTSAALPCGSILMQAVGQNLLISGTQWSLPDSSAAATLTLQSGNNVVFSASSGDTVTLGKNWSVNMIAGANFNTTPVSVTGNPTSGAGEIILTGNTGIQTVNGNIDLTAGGEILTGSSPIVSTGAAAAGGSPALPCGSILLQAIDQSILVGGTAWTLPNSSAAASLTLEAGNNITFSATSGDAVTLGNNWSVDMIAGANFNTTPVSVTGNPAKGAGEIILTGNTGIQTVNGNIDLTAGGQILTGNSPIVSTGAAAAAGSPALPCGSILLQAIDQNILVGGTAWNLPDSPASASLTLEAGNNIVFSATSGDSVTLGRNWSVDMIAGANFSTTPVSATGNPNSGSGQITMTGNTGIQTVNGNITLTAGGELLLANGPIYSTDGGSVLLQSISPAQKILFAGSQEWLLPPSPSLVSMTLQSGGGITFNGGGIDAGPDWNLNLVSGATFASPTSVNNQNTGSITLGSAALQTQNGNINVTTGGSITSGSGAIATMGGGNINVNAVGGSVNTGTDPNGYDFGFGVSTLLGGFSTAAGGNVTITAAGNITSFLPTGSGSQSDGGTGAFGPEPGVVTITAGGSVYGHYVVANSTVNGVVVPSTITAETGNAGYNGSLNLALSLVTGSWVVNAPKGSINLQEVRNPNGALNAVNFGPLAVLNNIFNYSPDASVTLNAGQAVNLLGGSQASVPRQTGYPVPILYPPILTINAGPGGVTLGDNLTLFPSSDGELTINTTVPAGTPPNAPGTPPPGSFEGGGFTLAVSDSSATRWVGAGTGSTDFASDHGATPIQINNSEPIVFDIAGNLDNVSIVSPKATQVTVGGNMDNVSFTGQNLHGSDVTSFNVAGQIFYPNTFALVTTTTPLTLPPALYPGAVQDYLQLLENAVLPGTGPSSPNGGLLFPNGLNLFYIPATHQLGYSGVMTPAIEAELLGSLQEITYLHNGKPALNLQNDYITTTTTFAATPAIAQAIQALFAASQTSISPVAAASGIVIQGPGTLDITAQSLNLGAALQGIASVGPADNSALAKIPGPGATIKINLKGDLDMFASQISSWFGGAIDINVGGAIDAGLPNLPFQQPHVPHGIWTSADSGISVVAAGNINIDGSRIAAFDGGNVFVESLDGNVEAGDGNLNEILVNEVVVNPKTGVVTTPQQPIAGSGILATTLPDAPKSLQVGNITVETPKGDIDAGVGGITQEPENGNTSLGPTVNLTSGGNINAGNTGVIAINVNAQATGAINGLFISSGNSTLHGDTLNVTDLAGGQANLSATGTISGLAIAGGGINIGGGKFEGVALSQNVSGGGAQSALASVASAATGSQNAAASEANSQKSETSDQPTSNNDDDLKRRGKRAVLAKYTGRVTVLLPTKQ